MKSCLVIDDSHVVRKVVCHILKDLGLSCDEAENGKQAYEYCLNNMPDIIILDWNMPVMSGIEFLEKLRDMENGEKPKVLLCTTEDDAAYIQRAMRAGANEYIMKPFDKTIVEAKFRQINIL